MLNSLNLDQIKTDLATQYHTDSLGRTPLNPLAMLKTQHTKHLLRIPSDRRLALRLEDDHKNATACGFQRQTPSHGLFTHFRAMDNRTGEKRPGCEGGAWKKSFILGYRVHTACCGTNQFSSTSH